MATIDITATDYFSAGANFYPQSSSTEYSKEARNIMDSLGNIECETMVQGKTNYRTSYKYCNSTPDIAGDLGTLLTTFGGQPVAGRTVTGMTITFNAGEYAEVEIEGVTYDDDNPILSVGDADVSAAVPASAGFGVPTLAGVTLGTDASPTSLTFTFSLDHKMAEGSDGNHFASANITPSVTASVEYVGVPTNIEPVTSWTTDGWDNTDANDDFDAASWEGHRYFDLNT